MGTVCETCGDEGFEEALVYCDSCKIAAVHRYCCGITPVLIDDYVIWFCSECEESENGFDCKEVDQVAVLMKSEEKKKEEDSNRTPLGSYVEDYELEDSTSNAGSIEVTSAPPVKETMGESEKKKTSKEEDKKNEESSSHPSPALNVEDHGLQDATSAEHMNESKKRKSSDGLQEATIVEPLKDSKKRKTSASRNADELNGLVRNEVSVLEKCEKKEEEKSSNHPSPVVAVQCATNVEPPKPQESSASGNPHESAGLANNGASVSEGGDSSNVPDHNSCTTSKKRRLSSGNIRVTSENTQLAAESSSCKEAESNMRHNDVLTATDFNSPVLNNHRALPLFEPIWRGSISVKHGNICSVNGLVAHLSSLACHKVHEKASSFHACLATEMFKRSEIWPETFLKNGPPTDESVALYFFPSRDSNEKKVYYSLVEDMKKDDLAMRCLLDNVELLLFTSYQLPMDCWKFHSKEYLWGIFRRRKTSRR